jgi:hypothetical protein
MLRHEYTTLNILTIYPIYGELKTLLNHVYFQHLFFSLLRMLHLIFQLSMSK